MLEQQYVRARVPKLEMFLGIKGIKIWLRKIGVLVDVDTKCKNSVFNIFRKERQKIIN